ncbi:MAG: hypothetical protein HY507_01850 [Candidatus Zambryskibacteria bacterium]|nr:hypothetical protein [Candidatus Zambryskibacteria bacterium]
MLSNFKKFFKKNKRRSTAPIDPDEIFIDSENLPDFDTDQFEGRIERPIDKNVFTLVAFFIVLIGTVFIYRLWDLEVIRGQAFRDRSDSNNLQKTVIIAPRGVIYDRNDAPLVWNAINRESSDFSLRVYLPSAGLSTILGYIKYPTKDSKGLYYQDQFEPKDGLEKIYDEKLSGKNGTKIVETDVKGNIISESVIEPAKNGENISLSLDIKLQKKLASSLLDIAGRAGYKGGAGVVMDIHTGEILAASNFPEYDSQVMTDGSDNKKIASWVNSGNHPFLNRLVDGLYTPGSIMKLFVAMGVLNEHVIDPRAVILSTGSISVPNPFFPDKPSVFLDWKAHGYVDLRQALAVSSNVYFYEVGGGYKNQKGIGIASIEKYAKMFGFGTTTGLYFPGEKAGTIPSPAWKAKNFNGEAWRVGDTYNTAIGQYGFQVSPMQVVRAVSAIANEGTLVTPTFIKRPEADIAGSFEPSSRNFVSNGRLDAQDDLGTETINLDQSFFKIVKEGMRLGVTEGTSQALNFPFVEAASKTGTAQLGISKDLVNSWVVGFWPYKEPKYAYAIVMERGSKNNQFGAVLVMMEFFDWLHIYAPEYLK